MFCGCGGKSVGSVAEVERERQSVCGVGWMVTGNGCVCTFDEMVSGRTSVCEGFGVVSGREKNHSFVPLGGWFGLVGEIVLLCYWLLSCAHGGRMCMGFFLIFDISIDALLSRDLCHVVWSSLDGLGFADILEVWIVPHSSYLGPTLSKLASHLHDDFFAPFACSGFLPCRV